MLFDGNPLVLDSAQAAEATRILDARRVVPVHHDS
jgi:L-ascorbate metabolism protein UlaG (beta-lactamase superfamily)